MGILNRNHEERLRRSQERLDKAVKEHDKRFYGYILRNYPAELIDLNQYVAENRRTLRKSELDNLYRKRSVMEFLLEKAKTWKKNQED